jgi:hypothetical protein
VSCPAKLEKGVWGPWLVLWWKMGRGGGTNRLPDTVNSSTLAAFRLHLYSNNSHHSNQTWHAVPVLGSTHAVSLFLSMWTIK